LSREQIICAAVDGQLKVQLRYSRYKPYVQIIKADPNAAYVFPIQADQNPAAIESLVHSNRGYQRFIIGDYVVYQPVNAR